MRIRPLLCLWLCLALAFSTRGEPEDHSPSAVEIEVYFLAGGFEAEKKVPALAP